MAGVSQPTVSRVLNNQKHHIKSSTREKVLKVIEENNYRPNYMARALSNGKTNCIGLMGAFRYLDFTTPVYSHTSMGVEKELETLSSEHSLVIFGATSQQSYERSIELIERRMVDGLILIVLGRELTEFQERLLPQLHKINLPFVAVHSTETQLACNNVG